MPKFAYCETKDVAFYAYSSGKFLDYGKYACVKDLTNIMSGDDGNGEDEQDDSDDEVALGWEQWLIDENTILLSLGAILISYREIYIFADVVVHRST